MVGTPLVPGLFIARSGGGPRTARSGKQLHTRQGRLESVPKMPAQTECMALLRRRTTFLTCGGDVLLGHCLVFEQLRVLRSGGGVLGIRKTHPK